MSIVAGQTAEAADFVSTSAGAGDSGKVPKLNSSGQLDKSFIKATFGGTGSDGALSISSGITTLDINSASYLVKNYTSISITGTAALAFSNPAANGSVVILKSQGDVTITTSATRAIDLRSLGATAGNGGSATGGGAATGGGGGGGASTENSGATGSAGSGTTGAGSDGTPAYAIFTNGAGLKGTNAGAGGTGGTKYGLVSNATLQALFNKLLLLIPGSGGGGGAGGDGFGGGGAGGAGGRGAGCLYIECAGAFNCTGTIDASGAAGGAGTGGATHGGGGGGGGGGGQIVILYRTLTADSGTYTVTGGTAGSGSGGGGNGGAGGNGIAIRQTNAEYF